jgi:hypothetical protein
MEYLEEGFYRKIHAATAECMRIYPGLEGGVSPKTAPVLDRSEHCTFDDAPGFFYISHHGDGQTMQPGIEFLDDDLDQLGIAYLLALHHPIQIGGYIVFVRVHRLPILAQIHGMDRSENDGPVIPAPFSNRYGTKSRVD